MAKGNIGANTYKAFWGNVKIKKGYIGTTRVYSAGNNVTYVVDTGISYQEEIDEGESCLSPATFTPAKDGWEFVGWRLDSGASAAVLDDLVMGDEPVTLYAVFQQTITLSYNANGGSGSTAAQTGSKYYNNGAVTNPSFSLRSNGFSRSNYNFSKWAMGSASGTQYAAGTSVTLSANTTFYAVWTYVGNPYYIAKEIKAKQYVRWYFTNYDGSVPEDNWYDWWEGYISRIGDTIDDEEAYIHQFGKADFDTKGNRKVTIKLSESYFNNNYSASVPITINGQTKSASVGYEQTWDVSNVSQFTIKVELKGSGDSFVGFEFIYLS